MSAQGVLAVMDAELSIYEQYGLIHGRTEAKQALIEARATVAELIESRARDLEVLERAAEHLGQAANLEKAKSRRMFYRTAQEMCADRINVLRAALARAGGAK